MILKINDKEFTIRKKTLADIKWLADTFGQDMKGLFPEGDNVSYANMARVVYHYLADKDHFKAEERTEFDENGFEKTYTLGGHAKLLSLVGEEDKENFIETFRFCILGDKEQGK